MISIVDKFTLCDDMQFINRAWCNRSQIKVPHRAQRITVPVGQSTDRRFRDVKWAAPGKA